MGLTTDAWIGHAEGQGPCQLSAELEGFKKLVLVLKDTGCRIVVVGNYATAVLSEKHKNKCIPPFVFNCTNCQEFYTAVVDEVFGNHEAPPLPDWCGQEYDEQRDRKLRIFLKMLQELGLGMTMRVVGHSLQAVHEGVVVDMEEFNCARCLDKVRATVEEVFGAGFSN